MALLASFATTWSIIAIASSTMRICRRRGFARVRSGAVESAIKQIDRRMKVSGAQWKPENVPQALQLRCAYLNGQLAV
jgi:hypothetical protein